METVIDPNAATFADDAPGNVALKIAAGDRWLAANSQAWAYMEGLAANEVAHQRRSSFRWLVEEARKKSFVDAAGEPFKINNNYVPYLARVMLKQHPAWAECMNKPRRSVYDRMM